MTEVERIPDNPAEEEQLFYEEPPRSSVAEGFGVLLALLALAVIGFAGYVWLTPGVEFADYLQRAGKADMATMPATGDEHSHASMPGMESMESTQEDVRCPVCNMFALHSKSAIMASWSDGTETHHDSWDCVANWAADNGLQLSDAQVVAFTDADVEPVWLDAKTAWYRYGTEANVSGSMPPNVAAFADQTTAKTAADMGGETLDFKGLLAKFGLEHAAGNAALAGSDSTAGESMVTMEMDSSSSMEHSPEDSMDSELDASESGMEMPSQADNSSLYEQAGFTDNSCPVCGMYADRSMTHVVVKWTDGSFTQHDSFDCAFGQQAAGGGQIDAIEVSLYDLDNPGSSWSDARSASFLYNTSRIKGSMPPFVAAFGSVDEASAAQPGLGGELLSVTELAARWQQ